MLKIMFFIRTKIQKKELVTICNQLRMQSVDGKYYKTDVVNTIQNFGL